MANILFFCILLEPTVPAGHVQVSVSPQVQEPHPSGDIHHSERPGDHGVTPTIPQGQERGEISEIKRNIVNEMTKIIFKLNLILFLLF